jgi:hypothetical protein
MNTTATTMASPPINTNTSPHTITADNEKAPAYAHHDTPVSNTQENPDAKPVSEEKADLGAGSGPGTRTSLEKTRYDDPAPVGVGSPDAGGDLNDVTRGGSGAPATSRDEILSQHAVGTFANGAVTAVSNVSLRRGFAIGV